MIEPSKTAAKSRAASYSVGDDSTELNATQSTGPRRIPRFLRNLSARTQAEFPKALSRSVTAPPARDAALDSLRVAHAPPSYDKATEARQPYNNGGSMESDRKCALDVLLQEQCRDIRRETWAQSEVEHVENSGNDEHTDDLLCVSEIERSSSLSSIDSEFYPRLVLKPRFRPRTKDGEFRCVRSEFGEAHPSKFSKEYLQAACELNLARTMSLDGEDRPQNQTSPVPCSTLEPNSSRDLSSSGISKGLRRLTKPFIRSRTSPCAASTLSGANITSSAEKLVSHSSTPLETTLSASNDTPDVPPARLWKTVSEQQWEVGRARTESLIRDQLNIPVGFHSRASSPNEQQSTENLRDERACQDSFAQGTDRRARQSSAVANGLTLPTGLAPSGARTVAMQACSTQQHVSQDGRRASRSSVSINDTTHHEQGRSEQPEQRRKDSRLSSIGKGLISPLKRLTPFGSSIPKSLSATTAEQLAEEEKLLPSSTHMATSVISERRGAMSYRSEETTSTSGRIGRYSHLNYQESHEGLASEQNTDGRSERVSLEQPPPHRCRTYYPRSSDGNIEATNHSNAETPSTEPNTPYSTTPPHSPRTTTAELTSPTPFPNFLAHLTTYYPLSRFRIEATPPTWWKEANPHPPPSCSHTLCETYAPDTADPGNLYRIRVGSCRFAIAESWESSLYTALRNGEIESSRVVRWKRVGVWGRVQVGRFEEVKRKRAMERDGRKVRDMYEKAGWKCGGEEGGPPRWTWSEVFGGGEYAYAAAIAGAYL